MITSTPKGKLPQIGGLVVRSIKTVVTAAIAAAMLLSSGVLFAQTVERDGDTATAIKNLSVGGLVYDVYFTLEAPSVLYSEPPVFPFSKGDADTAIQAVVDVLNAEGDILRAGPNAAQGLPDFRISWASVPVETEEPIDPPIRLFIVTKGETNPTTTPGVWMLPDEGDSNIGPIPGNFADFVIAGSEGPGNIAPVADANGPYSGPVDTAIAFDGSASSDSDGSIVSWEWDFGDDMTGIGETTTHTYTAAGVYNVTLTVTDDLGLPDSDNSEASIDQGAQDPVADAGGPYTGEANVLVNFDGSNSVDPDGTITSWDWDFGDSNTGSGEMVTHTYTTANNFTVTLTVTDNSTATGTSTTSASITAGNQPPVADAGGPYSGEVDVAMSFDGSASFDPNGGSIIYDWKFGDGGLGTGVAPSYTYTTAGNYEVTLTVTDSDNDIGDNVTSATIGQIVNAPVANAGGPYTGAIDLEVTFDGSASTDSDGTIDSWDWHFGDGTSGTGETPGHTYLAAGNYPVSLTVTDNDGARSLDITSAAINVSPQAPSANTGGPYSGTVGIAVAFDGSGSTDPNGNIDTYAWDFDDTNTANTEMASNTYLASGIYRVSLTVTDNDAESDVGETIAVIGEGNLPPTADAAGPYAADVGVDINFNGSASSDPDGTIMSWDWNFGDDTTGSGEMVTHAYAASADYNVTLTVTDDDGTPASASTVAQVAAVADLSVGAISVSPSSVGLGAEATYTIPVNNAGPSEDPGVTALITLPGNATFGSSSATQGTCAEDAGTVTCDLGAIAGAGSATITVIVTAPSEPSSMTLSASVSGLAIDPTPDDNTASSDVSVQDTIDVTVEVRGGGSVGPLEFAFAALFVGIALLMRRRAVPMVTVAALAILLYPASDSWAQTDNVWYIGGSAGSSQGNYDANDLTSDLSGLGWSLSNASVDDSDTAWKVFGGVNLSKVFGVEAGYFDLGEITSTFDASVTPAEVDELLRDASEVDGFLASGIYAAGTARFSFADDRFAIFGKAGFAAWNKETNATVINGATGAGAAEDSGVNGMLGIGANWYFLRNFGVRAEYERYNVGRWVDMISVGVEYKFD